jgi:hypothetical protein
MDGQALLFGFSEARGYDCCNGRIVLQSGSQAVRGCGEYRRWLGSGAARGWQLGARQDGGPQAEDDFRRTPCLFLERVKRDFTLRGLVVELAARGVKVITVRYGNSSIPRSSASKKRMARPIRKWFRHDNLISLHQRIRSRGASPAKMEIRASWA